VDLRENLRGSNSASEAPQGLGRRMVITRGRPRC
jgi:hypothetical protein